VTEARVAVAYSGGRDSTALLHATLRAAAPFGIGVVALHVHHGLHPNADDWLAHCRRRCERWTQAGHRLHFASERLTTSPRRGESVEAWARTSRYAALRRMALEHRADLVLLAHHQQDQAETFLLQARRGGGTCGLAGMPRVVERDGLTWARPWLAQPRDAIEAYLRRHRLGHVDDDSNADERLARNRLRHQVLPTLNLAFPQAELALTTAAEWAREASVCLRELAQLDLAAISHAESLRIATWIALTSERRSNALRYWLRERAPGSVSAALVKRLMSELPVCANGRWPLPGGELRSHRGVLTFAKTPLAIPDRPSVPETSLRVNAAGAYPLPGWGGVLRATVTQQAGVGIAALRRLELLPRTGAEQFQAGAGRPARALKKQYQAAGVPADQRGGPLIYSAGRLLFVPGLGIDSRAIAPPGEPQMTLEWSDGSFDAALGTVGAPSLDR